MESSKPQEPVSSPGRREGLGTKPPEPSAKLGGEKRREPKDSGREVGRQKQVGSAVSDAVRSRRRRPDEQLQKLGENTYAGWGWGIETRLQSARCEEMEGASADSPFKTSG